MSAPREDRPGEDRPANRPAGGSVAADLVAPITRGLIAGSAVDLQVGKTIVPLASAEIGKAIADSLSARIPAGLLANPNWAVKPLCVSPVVATEPFEKFAQLVATRPSEKFAQMWFDTVLANLCTGRHAEREFAAAATGQVEKAHTLAEFGAAVLSLISEAGFTLGSLAQRVKDLNEQDGANIVGLTKPTLSSVSRGHRLFRDLDQVEHLVRICGADADRNVWVAAWHRAKKRRAEPVVTDRPDAPSAGSDAEDDGERETVSWLTGPDDEVLFQIPVTRQQVRAALVAMVVIGVVASGTDSPVIRTAGFATLGAAAGLALVDHTRRLPSAA